MLAVGPGGRSALGHGGGLALLGVVALLGVIAIEVLILAVVIQAAVPVEAQRLPFFMDLGYAHVTVTLRSTGRPEGARKCTGGRVPGRSSTCP